MYDPLRKVYTLFNTKYDSRMIEKQDYLNTIKTDIKNNKSQNIFIIGPKGKGKTTTQMCIQEYIQPDFDPSLQVVFTKDEYLQNITRLKPGSVIIWDESGTGGSGLSSRESMSQKNKDTADVWQMVRTKKIITVFVSLDMDRVDKRIRQTFEYYVTPVRQLNDVETGGNGLQIECIVKQNDTRHDNKADVFEYGYTKLKYGKRGNVRSCVLFLPSQAKIIQYEKKREVQLNMLIAKAQGQISFKK